MPYDRYDKDFAIAGVVWILIMGILLYSFFKKDTNSNPAMGT